MEISSAVLAVSLVLILNKKQMGKFCQVFSVFSPPFISALIILLASLRSGRNQMNFQQLLSFLSRRIYKEGLVVITSNSEGPNPDWNIAIIIVNSTSLVIIIGSLAYIFR